MSGLNHHLPRLMVVEGNFLQLLTLAGLVPYTKRKEDGA